MPVGFRVFEREHVPDPDLVAQVAAMDPADISDGMYFSRTMTGIHPQDPSMARATGPAVTVNLPLGGTYMLKLAMSMCQAGDVLVVNARGDAMIAMWGGHISVGMKELGLAGVVIDGAIRDLDEIVDSGLPVFARDNTPTHAIDDAPGEINIPIACGGTVVRPGDIVSADRNGIVVVPYDEVPEVIASAKARIARMGARPFIEDGRMSGSDELRQLVTERGCEFVDGPHG